MTNHFCASCGFELVPQYGPTGAEPQAPVIGAPPPAPLASAAPAPAASTASTRSGGSNRRLWVTLGIVIFVAVVAAAGAVAFIESGALTPHHTITGTLALSNAAIVTGSECKGYGGYADIVAGAGVVLKDGDGKILGTSELGTGSGTAALCTFPFTIYDVPEVSFYSVEVSHRGQVTESLADLKASNWTFILTLGK